MEEVLGLSPKHAAFNGLVKEEEITATAKRLRRSHCRWKKQQKQENEVSSREAGSPGKKLFQYGERNLYGICHYKGD